jgi:hypothetical protein
VSWFTSPAIYFAREATASQSEAEALEKALKRSRSGAAIPNAYKAMCHEYGEIVQHNLDHGVPFLAGTAT